MKSIAKLDALNTLNLANTRIGDNAIPELAKVKSLKTLNLRQTKVTPAGKEKLAKELPGCKIEWSMSREK